MPDAAGRLRQLIGSHTAGGHWDDGVPMSVAQVLGEATVGELADAVHADQIAPLQAERDDERAARRTAAESADRFRDVLSEALGYEDENPGDDVLVATLREHFGKTGPEPTRWRDFLTAARAQVDQIAAEPTRIHVIDLTEEET